MRLYAVKLSARAAVISRLDQGLGLHLQDGALMWLLAGDLSFLSTWTSQQGRQYIFTSWQLTSPRANDPREKESKLKATMSFMAYSLKSLLLWQCLSTLKGRRNCVCVRERERKNERKRNTTWHLFRSFLLGQFLAFNSINWFLLSTSYVPYTLLNTWNSLSHLILNRTLRDSVVHSHRDGL